MTRVSPGTTGRRNLTPSIPAKKNCFWVPPAPASCVKIVIASVSRHYSCALRRCVASSMRITNAARRRGERFVRQPTRARLNRISPSSPGSNITNPPTCAIASTINTPGMIGRCGKCPGKKLSLMVTFFTPMAYDPTSISTTRSTSRNGYRCGSKFMMASMSMAAGRFFPMPLAEEPGSGAAAAAATATRRA